MGVGAKKILLPRFSATEITVSTDHNSTAIAIPLKTRAEITYYVRPKYCTDHSFQAGGKNDSNKLQYNLFPVVLDGNGVPWAEAVVYIMDRLGSVVSPAMATYSSIAEDLSAYRRFLDEAELDWICFHPQKLSRPTYRFNGHLKFAVQAGEVAATTAQRRMGSVIRFYRWLIKEGVLAPEHSPWKETDRFIDFKDTHGFERTKKVITTDVSIKVPKQYNPYDGAIDDGGKLRPLTPEEQEWVLDALVTLGNTEMMLVHLFGFLTGARIQTILTFRVRHAMIKLEDKQQGELRLPIGPGTGIDTKHNKQTVLHVPLWFYRMLQTYAYSSRSLKRRERAAGGDHENQYLFLSVRGASLYQSKEDLQAFDNTNELRHIKTGQGVRQFISEYVIPFVRCKYGENKFHYQFHDTRATAGMNWTDHQLKLVEQGQTTLSEAREFVKTRMGHNSASTTDRYLQYRQNLKLVRWAGQGYECHLQRLCEQAIGLI